MSRALWPGSYVWGLKLQGAVWGLKGHGDVGGLNGQGLCV